MFKSRLGFVLKTTLGAFVVLYPFLAGHVARHRDAMVAALPVLVAAVYLVMSSGLAYGAHGAGQPEELLHLPFVWAYFVACIWTGAALHLRREVDLYLPNDTHWNTRGHAIAADAVLRSVGLGTRVAGSAMPPRRC